MKYVSGLDDIIEQKTKYGQVFHNIDQVIKIVKDTEQQDIDAHKNLERKFVSLCFGINLVNDDYEEINRTIQKQFHPSKEGIDKYELQKSIFNYLSHIDSTLDYLDKFIKDLKKVDLKYERKNYAFDKIINELRNEIIHEGIPTIYVIYSGKNQENNFSCCQFAGTINLDENETLYIELKINNKKYDLQQLMDVTYKPMIKKISKIIGLID